MARDRKRARQRKERPARKAARRTSPVPSGVPAALEHASGNVDELDAAIVRGAAEAGDLEQGTGEPADGPSAAAAEAGELAGEDVDALAADMPDEAEVGLAPRTAAASRGVPAERAARQSLPARAIAFLRASVAELQRMQWPDRRQTSQATAVVLGFVVVAGVYLGVADWIAQKIVNLIV
ncbi:MAG: preprotein translocase subunit SecE [Solirubrobacteraceae bacterium]